MIERFINQFASNTFIMTEKWLVGTEDLGDCRSCGYLLQLLARADMQNENDGIVYMVRARDDCGDCSRKPPEIIELEPKPNTNHQYGIRTIGNLLNLVVAYL